MKDEEVRVTFRCPKYLVDFIDKYDKNRTNFILNALNEKYMVINEFEKILERYELRKRDTEQLKRKNGR